MEEGERDPAAPSLSTVQEEDWVQWSDLEAVLFDLDGVITESATLHARAWKESLDSFLEKRREQGPESREETGRGGRDVQGLAPFRPFDLEEDYLRYVDGKPRHDGVRDFLASRGLSLPEGEEADPPGAGTVHGIGNRKNERFLALVDEVGAPVYPSSIALMRELRERGIKVGGITSSRNGTRLIRRAGIEDLFDAWVDGEEAARLGLPGKPAPDTFLEAARRLGVEPARAAVVEDAVSGVRAGRGGHFGLVIGVDRSGEGETLLEAGADIVVKDLEEMAMDQPGASHG